MFKLVSILFEAFTGEELEIQLMKYLNLSKKDFGIIKNIKSKLKPNNPLKISHLRGKISNKGLSKLLPGNISKRLENIPTKTRNKIMKQFQTQINKESKDKKKIDVMINYEGEIKLSSSFLQYGIFEMEDENAKMGKLTLAISGKEYDFGKVKTTIWIAMVQAQGKDGTGAGSVLWNTIWYHKRTKTLTTGGVAGSIEALIKSKRRIYAQIARNSKLVNRFAELKNSARAQEIAKAQKTARKVRIRNKQRAQRRAK